MAHGADGVARREDARPRGGWPLRIRPRRATASRLRARRPVPWPPRCAAPRGLAQRPIFRGKMDAALFSSGRAFFSAQPPILLVNPEYSSSSEKYQCI